MTFSSMIKTMQRFKKRKLTRRGFVAGMAGAAASAAALTLDGCGGGGSVSEELTAQVQAAFPDAFVEYLDVDPSQIIPSTDMTDENISLVDYLTEVNSFDLPLGSLVYQSSDTQALVIAPGAASNALTRLGIVDFTSGQFAPILGQALGQKEDFVIYDARASATAVIWVECHMVHGLWRVYASSVANGVPSEEAMQQAQLVDSGESLYAPPQLAASANKVYWTVMPDPNGPASGEDSYLKAVEFSSGTSSQTVEPYIVYVSHGRMITNPLVSGDVLTIVPRVDTDGVYYQLTTLDLKTDAVRNIAILPPSLRVSDAVWLDKGFAFSIEGNYDYAKGLSLFGTYQHLGDGQYLYVNKAPVSAPVQIKNLTYVKSTKNIVGLDTDFGTFVILATPQECVDYGDVLAGAGKQSRLVAYTTVTSKTGSETGTCHVRVFDPL